MILGNETRKVRDTFRLESSNAAAANTLLCGVAPTVLFDTTPSSSQLQSTNLV
jgi:hypothetical protein